MICTSCQNHVPDEALFCSNCGMATGKIELRTTIKNSPETNGALRTPKIEGELDPRIGLVLDSKYELIELLGQGGMGAVYRAHRLHIGDEVAVKLLSRDLIRDRQAIERFRREARSAALIRHPNVVSIHDFNDEGLSGTHEAYIVMELVKGESLRQLLERAGRLPPERAVSLMLDICAGVGVAHRQGLLHRDLKPDNVIVAPPTHEGEHETAKVVDFGLAKVRDEISPLTQTGILMGTIYYMSPEQCRGEDLDARTDVYSLGAMLYEMLSGDPPFRANNLTGLINKHLNEAPPPLDYSLGIPAALSAVFFKALAKSRHERQADALIFSKELKAAPSSPPPDRRSNENIEPVLISQQSKTSSQQTSHGGLLKWTIILVPSLLLAAVLAGLLIWFAIGFRNNFNGNTSANNSSLQPTPIEESNVNSTSVATSASDLRGTWTGTYGSVGTAATLVIKNHNGDKFDGILEQGQVRVSFEGTIKSGAVTMKQTKVLTGEGWSLGEDTGTLSSDGKRISGTGKDALSESLGISYQWSFSR